MAKINFKAVFTSSIGALAGGAAAGYVTNMLQENLPDNAKKFATYGPLLLGAFLTTQKDAMLKNAGLGMIGSSGPGLLASMGVTGPLNNRLAGPGNRMMLTAAQQAAVLDQVRRAQEIAKVNGRGAADLSKYQDIIENS